ncbi:ribosome rescue GTPase HflX [Microbulbifer yueqingensis]|uniref:GTPase HflX n=1 Tax=Microbulbifer yueqingensis TaxID=658219 RepID=A0A1G9CYM6_9GAMM|nr:ribosome rescue GTPase HflX [Microbulbifer yueqingensis]SDK56732.1 GTP-binding protein HflX [Microbulbifer yueqingensis]
MFFERPESGELAVLVHLELSAIDSPEDPREFEELALSAGADPVTFIFGQRAKPDPRTFVGRGKLEEIQQAVREHGAELVIFDHNLSPSQERNIERELRCRVLDRTGLILDIFAQRARTHEGKLQVELAQLRHMATRLVRGWTHLERQKGGIGLRGPGETQLETDRRLLRARIDSIEKRLEKVRRQRDQGRRARTRAEVPTVSLVGYTNAGKSTLFNRLTDAGVYVRDQLFATLDPTMRRVELPSVGGMILADTVGFVSHLPHRLVEAFRATLEEAASATLLLHVVDAASDDRLRLMEEVQLVLEEIGAADLPQLVVYNKIDLLAAKEPTIDRDADGVPRAVWLSAVTGEGCELLVDAISERLGEQMVRGHLLVAARHSRLRAQLYEMNAVKGEEYRDNGDCELELVLPRGDLQRLLAPFAGAADGPQWRAAE